MCPGGNQVVKLHQVLFALDDFGAGGGGGGDRRKEAVRLGGAYALSGLLRTEGADRMGT